MYSFWQYMYAPIASPFSFELVLSVMYFTLSPVEVAVHSCEMCTYSGNGTQEGAVPDLLCLVDLYLVYLI